MQTAISDGELGSGSYGRAAWSPASIPYVVMWGIASHPPFVFLPSAWLRNWLCARAGRAAGLILLTQTQTTYPLRCQLDSEADCAPGAGAGRADGLSFLTWTRTAYPPRFLLDSETNGAPGPAAPPFRDLISWLRYEQHTRRAGLTIKSVKPSVNRSVLN